MDESTRPRDDAALPDAGTYAEAIVQTVREPLLVLDGALRVRAANRSFYHTFRVTPGETEGRLLYDLGNRQWDIPALRRLLEDILPRQTTLEDYAVEHDFPGVGRKAVLLNARRLRGGRDGDELLLAIEDVTERRRAGEALRQAQERLVQAERLAAIGRTVAVLTHESRGAMQRVSAALERLGWRLKDQPEELVLARQAQQGLAELERLFEDVRDYAAPIRLDRRPCDLAVVWREAWKHVLARHAGRDASMREETGGLDLKVEADCFRLGQVFRNVLDNALAAAADPVRVEMCCREADLGGRPALRVAVRDNGRGLTPGARARLFEAFYTTKPSGTGLGLSVCRRIVDAHGGRIEVGDHPGPGAEIVVTLPRRGG